MQTSRNAVSSAILAVSVVVVLVVGLAGGYYAGLSSATHVTTTVSTTVTSVSSATGNPLNNATNGISSSLIASAKAEGGALTLYGLADAPAWTAPGGPVSTFQALYPWAHVSYLSLTTGDETNKMLAEYKAGAVQSDVSQQNAAPSISNFGAGIYAPFCNPYEATVGFPAGVLAGPVTTSDANCVFHPAFGNYAAFAWNTNLVTTAQAATFTKWSQITDPQWKGVMVVDKPQRLSTFGGILEKIGENMTYSQWVAYMNQFKANQPILAASLGTVFDDLSTGQASVGITTTDDLVQGVKPGVPVAYEWINPIPVLSTFFAMTKGAPHPAMAELWIYFITSYNGQVSEGNAGRLPLLPSAAQVTVLHNIQVPIPAGFSYYPNPDARLLNNQTKILALYQSIFGT